MKIYGVDFTSAPSRQKPIIYVAGEFTENMLYVEDYLLKSVSLNEFEVFLKRRSPWICGFDFPFGQPRKLINNLGWPQTWAEYVGQVAVMVTVHPPRSIAPCGRAQGPMLHFLVRGGERLPVMSQQEFEEALATYRQSRPVGDKQHLRATDIKAKARSPMMVYGVPVGKMFFKGAPRLLRSKASILPCHPTNDNRIALETYPALVARKWLAKRRYKSDDVSQQTNEQQTVRHDLINGLRSPQFLTHYGFHLEFSNSLADKLIQDPTADSLDSLLCAIQAAWAYTQQDHGYGLPTTCDPLEGRIVDPEMI